MYVKRKMIAAYSFSHFTAENLMKLWILGTSRKAYFVTTQLVFSCHKIGGKSLVFVYF